MQINQNFDSGNILVKSIIDNSATLEIRDDTNSEFKQWFYFQVTTEVGVDCTFNIANANSCSYAKGWDGYSAVASYDGVDWFRVATEFDGDQLTIKHTFEYNSIFFAYFAPYSYQRHQQLIFSAQQSPICHHKVIGQTVEGRNMDLLVVGNENRKPIWIIARQHPGESMAEWCAEGLVDSLLDEDRASSQLLLDNYCFYIVPNMNPDGSVNGNLRSNAAGANLNREWSEPSAENSPEVLAVRSLMQETGVEAFLDLHGDEGLPYVFVAGAEGNPSYSEKVAKLETNFSNNLMSINPDFQMEYGYDKDEPGKADLRIATNWVGEEFGCLSYTLEMPFKDNANLPNTITGWSPERSYVLGESLLQALYQTLK